MSHDPADIAAAVFCFALAALILVGLVWWLRDRFDDWLDRRLLLDFGADSDTPIYEATVKALRYRPEAS